MNDKIIKRIIRMVNLFSIAAEKEDLPINSKDTKTILSNLENLETFNARKNYAEKNLKHLSSGSSRIVLLTAEKTIIKLAKNDRGIAQNETEANLKTKSKFFNPTISFAKNFSWIETNYLDKITAKDFEKLTKINFDDFGEAIRYGLKKISGNIDKEKPDHFDTICKSDIYNEVKEVGLANKLMGGDLARISSWGKKDNHPVLLDTGLTRKVFDDFYESSSS